MQPKIVAQTRATILPLYRYFGLRDWLVEPHIEETQTLLESARETVVASDGFQLVVHCEQSEESVQVICQFWRQRPPEVDGQAQGVREIILSSPSGEIFIDQPTMLAVDLTPHHKFEPGLIGVRVMWRGRRGQGLSRATGPLQHSGETYNLQLWQQ
ncbi:hypothetical protein [Micromonospora tarensis]|uniref:Uncharacterized protein n=1 Tax=Micromonospora tarensis TaxID=2806100 RepID=A0ABS1YAU2_9ACTN|nr:hypothetical protein [Micromonospora tarensis]MBM0274521.1 hypothetical protein [Micromonospora tarensis]